MFILYVLGWILIGFVVALVTVALDIRGKKYDPRYFDGMWETIIMTIVFWPLAVVFLLNNYLREKEIANKIMWKLANIGVKRNKKMEDPVFGKVDALEESVELRK